MDGDPDLEDSDLDEAADDVGEVEPWRPEGIWLDMPIYGVDQSKGPVNEIETTTRWQRALNDPDLAARMNARNAGWQRFARGF